MSPELNHIDPELFCIAARLHRKRNLPPELADVFGEVLQQVTRMSTFLLMKKNPQYLTFRALFLDPETQSGMLVHALSALCGADLRRKPESVVGLVVTSVQNRLRNLARDTCRRQKHGTTILASEGGFDAHSRVCDLGGVVRTNYNHPKTSNVNDF
jgi:hypothetical protein